MKSKKKGSSVVDKIVDQLRYGKSHLYYHKDCPACHKQVEELGLTFGKLNKLKGVHECSMKSCPGVPGYPTWVNGYGDQIVGVQKPSSLYKKLNKKFKKGMTFGKIYTSAPQYNGETSYCGLPGNHRGYNLSTVEDLLARADNMGPLLGLRFGAGGLLQRPYGPKDNQELKEMHLAGSKLHPFDLDWVSDMSAYHSYGKRNPKRYSKKKRRRSKPKNKRRGSLKRTSKRSLKRNSKVPSKFGIATPGSKDWGGLKKGSLGDKWVSPQLKGAKGFNPNPALLYLPVPESQSYTISPDLSLNVPMRYSNNQMNKPSLKYGSKNNVGYRPPFHMYDNPGGHTTDWLTGKSYLPNGKKLQKVQKTTTNPTGYLSNSKTVHQASSRPNGGRVLSRNGSRKFGIAEPPKGMFYTKDTLASNAKTQYQPVPAYMDKKPTKLSTKFGGKIITLDPKGKITITNPP